MAGIGIESVGRQRDHDSSRPLARLRRTSSASASRGRAVCGARRVDMIVTLIICLTVLAILARAERYVSRIVAGWESRIPVAAIALPPPDAPVRGKSLA